MAERIEHGELPVQRTAGLEYLPSAPAEPDAARGRRLRDEPEGRACLVEDVDGSTAYPGDEHVHVANHPDVGGIKRLEVLGAAISSVLLEDQLAVDGPGRRRVPLN